MNRQGRVGLVALVIAAAAGFGCGGSDIQTGTHDITFMGAVVDGATGLQIKTYSITLVYGSHTIKGKVDAATGRYVVGPLPAWNDYGILIKEDTGGYRDFSSYNAGIDPPTPPPASQASDVYKSNTSATLDFDAVLFPTNITSPSVNVVVSKSDALTTIPTPAQAAGTYRLTPTTLQPLIQTQLAEVAGQTWANDNDLFAAVVSDSFTNGKFTVDGAKLLYGVNYQITVYNVDTYQPAQGTVSAGISLGASITVSPQTVLPLMMVSNTASTCTVTRSLAATSTALITFTFNQAVEDGTTTSGGAKEAFDNGLIAGTNFGTPLPLSTSTTVQERGTSFSISDTTVSVSWNPSLAFPLPLTNETLSSFDYNLLNVSLQPVGHPTQRVSMATLFGVGASYITCMFTP